MSLKLYNFELPTGHFKMGEFKQIQFPDLFFRVKYFTSIN